MVPSMYICGYRHMGLPIPEEPKDIKMLIKDVRKRLSNLNEVGSDALAVWSFNKLPKYLWDCWKDELKNRGIAWQKFLIMLKLRTMDIIEWGIYDRLSWAELMNRMQQTIETYQHHDGEA